MKPIPENRRWVEQGKPDQSPPRVSNESVIEIDLLASELLALLTEQHEQLLEAGAPLLFARYEGTCPACLQPIQQGALITRHARSGRWVHVDCMNAPVQHSIPARYEGFCRICRQTIAVGEPITRDANRGWVHLRCVQG